MSVATFVLYCPNDHTWGAEGTVDESGFTGPANCPHCDEDAESFDPL